MTNKVLNILCDLLVKQNELINALLEENIAIEQQNMQLRKACKQWGEAVDFYISKLNEAEKQLQLRKGLDDGN